MSRLTLRVGELISLSFFLMASISAAECPAPPSPAAAAGRFRQLDRQAQVEFRRGEFAKAAAVFRQATCAAPESLRPYYELYGAATEALVAAKFSEAWQLLQEADRLHPEYALPLAMLVKTGLVAGDMDSLKKALLRIAQRFPHDAKLHADLAQDLLHEKLQNLALAEALRSETIGPLDAKTSVNLTVLEMQMGAFNDALSHALRVEAQEGFPRKTRASGAALAGLAYEGLGQPDEAIQHLELSIRLDPEQENPYLALARISEKYQNTKTAAEILQQAQKRFPDSDKVTLALGSSLLSAEQYESAARLLEKLIQTSPAELEAYPRLAEAYRNIGEPARATQTLRKLARRKPDDAMLHVIIAESMLDEEQVDYPRVLEELALTEKASPENYDVFYLRGRVYLLMKQHERAIAALRHAIELRATEPNAYYQLGRAYSRSGRQTLAKEQFKRRDFLRGPQGEIKTRD